MNMAFCARLFVVIVLMWAAGGCSPSRDFNAVPESLVDQAVIAGMPHVRTWGDRVENHYIQSLVESVHQTAAYYAAHPDEPMPETADLLLISGGGDKGAYGAGLLNGWTDAGDRPDFKLVTGISTGALIAPLAFLGPDYDHILREGYTNISAEDIAESRGFLAILNRDGIADTDPLAELVLGWMDDKALRDVAAEHAKGRRLLIATINAEAQRPVIWDMGAIASSDHPGAGDLFRKVMLASASVPGAFEPQYFEVEVNGQTYEEMHIDGGTMAQVFLWGEGIDLDAISARAGVPRNSKQVRIFVLRNGRFEPEYQSLRPLVIDITGRAIGTLIKTQAIGDMYRLYTRAQRDGMDFNMASIPPTFDMKPEEPFDRDYMNALFQVGYDRARSGYPWQKTPPYLVVDAAGD